MIKNYEKQIDDMKIMIEMLEKKLSFYEVKEKFLTNKTNDLEMNLRKLQSGIRLLKNRNKNLILSLVKMLKIYENFSDLDITQKVADIVTRGFNSIGQVSGMICLVDLGFPLFVFLSLSISSLSLMNLTQILKFF